MNEKRYKFDSRRTGELVSLIKTLTALRGVSSAEGEASVRLKEILSKICDRCEIQRNGNVLGFISAHKDSKTVMLEAHIDRIGLMVTKICDDGLIKFSCIGGVDERILTSAEVTILGKEDVYGVICKVKSDDMRIDTGFSAEKLADKIKVGDMVIINSVFTQLLGDKLSCAAMDNRAGIAAILSALKRIDKTNLKYNIVVLLSVQEELGLHGAYTGAESQSPDAAIVVDVTHGTTHDTKNEVGVFPLGSGAAICRGPNFDYEYTVKLMELCDSFGIPYTIEAASGPSGTSAWATQISGGGIPSMLLSIPVRYMHTNVETLAIKDADAVAELIANSLEGGLKLD